MPGKRWNQTPAAISFATTFAPDSISGTRTLKGAGLIGGGSECYQRCGAEQG